MNEVETIPALGIEVVSALGDTRQLKMTTYVSRDASASEINALLDKALAAADRQEAKYKCEKVAEDIEDGERTLQNLHDDVTRLDDEHKMSLARIDVQAGFVRDEIAKINEAVNAAGRAKALGAQGAQLHNLEEQFNAYKTQKETLESERKNHKGNIGVTIARHEQHLAKLRTKLAALTATAGG